MNGDGGPTDRPHLEDLVDRARTKLKDWTDRDDSDPGVALLELFAFVAELLGRHSDEIAAEAYLGTGRRHESAGRRPTCGVYAAVVLDNTDPLGQRRLFLRVPGVSGDEGVWAQACLPVPGTPGVPATGDGVWVALESCDPSRPVWLGRRITG